MVGGMDKYAIGFWGCYFGSAGLMLAGSVFAYIRSLRRIAVNAAASALASTFFVVAFLGGLPISDAATLDRFLAHVASLVSAIAGLPAVFHPGHLAQPEVPAAGL
jgi:hypothetical protein